MNEIDLDYFNGLSIKEILQLARKSIKITSENRKLEDENEKLKAENADIHYIASDLADENEELKERASFINADRCAEIMRYKKCLDEIEGICKKAWHDSGITIDYLKRNNYSWKQHQIRSLICRFEQIMQKIEKLKFEQRMQKIEELKDNGQK